MPICLLSDEKVITNNLIGSKAKNLALMIKSGIDKVPFGYIVYGDYDEVDIEQIWKSIAHKNFLVVRSSMEGEDELSSSNAGKYKTIVGINNLKDLKMAVKEVMNVNLRNKSCIIQRLIEPSVSGVLFSNFHQMAVIEAVVGLGETLVSGFLTPDTYFVDGGCIKEQTISPKSFAICINRNYEIGQVVSNGKFEYRVVTNIGNKSICSISYWCKKVSCCSKEQIDSLFKIAKQIENLFEMPQDIEFCIDENQKIYILQSRPITSGLEMHRKCYGNEASILEGLVASNGKVIGVTETNINKVDKDKIYVTKMLTPEDAYLLSNVGGVICETGSLLSHVSIVLRELGIPCLINVANLTNVMSSDQRVELDCYQGYVKVLQ